MEMYHDGSLFDILGETLPWQLIALTLNLRLLGPVEVARQPHMDLLPSPPTRSKMRCAFRCFL